MAGMLRVSRSRGAFSGVLLVLLGIWGGLIPFVGPYVNYAYTPNHAWSLTSGRIWLEILPAAGALLGGLILLASKLRPSALFGASLAAASGAWFAVGGSLAPLWTNNVPPQGYPVGGHIARAMEQIGFFTGLGVVIVCIASVALGRLSLVSLRDARPVERATTTAGVEADTDSQAGTAPAGSRWPSPLTSPMRRAASSGSGESKSDSTAAKTSETSEPVTSSTNTR